MNRKMCIQILYDNCKKMRKTYDPFNTEVHVNESFSKSLYVNYGNFFFYIL